MDENIALIEAVCIHVQATLDGMGLGHSVGEAERGIVQARLSSDSLTEEDLDLLARKGTTAVFSRRVRAAVEEALRSALGGELPETYSPSEVVLAMDASLEATLEETIGAGFEKSLYTNDGDGAQETLASHVGQTLIFTHGEVTAPEGSMTLAGGRELTLLPTVHSLPRTLSEDLGRSAPEGSVSSTENEESLAPGAGPAEGEGIAVTPLPGIGQLASGDELARQLVALMERYAEAGRASGVSAMPSSREMVGRPGEISCA